MSSLLTPLHLQSPCTPSDPLMYPMGLTPASPVNAVRRGLLVAAGGLLASGLASAAPRVPPRAESPPVGMDPVAMSSGLAARWAAAMHRDMGWQARWQALGSLAVLAQLEAGDLPMGVFLATPRADALDRAGLIHDRHTLAYTDLLLVGPKEDVAGLRGAGSLVDALRQVLAAHAAGAAEWDAPAAGDALADWVTKWSPGLPRTNRPPVSAPLSALPYRLVTRAAWSGRAADRQARIWAESSPDQAVALQVARSFRSRHPGAGLLVKWLQAPLAMKQVRAGAPGWRAAGR
ncbi:hypothetical protein GTZ97_01810 [Aquabacterium fontiphilum]|uniref:hypothetical protein n=1 Tax=Aquabacterium fontiphilum TaxID=450365 RepID=UPI001377EC99|nr:hypothetical protein [Aquabacterium fontiphilum]NBD19410.1 hypothetical protein [Aquabacterium fontiphilum]